LRLSETGLINLGAGACLGGAFCIQQSLQNFCPSKFFQMYLSSPHDAQVLSFGFIMVKRSARQ
jgi:hypothetical protein